MFVAIKARKRLILPLPVFFISNKSYNNKIKKFDCHKYVTKMLLKKVKSLYAKCPITMGNVHT